MVSSRSFPPARKEKERTGWKKIEKEADRYESVRGKLRLKLGRSLYYLHRQEAVHRANYLFICFLINIISHLHPIWVQVSFLLLHLSLTLFCICVIVHLCITDLVGLFGVFCTVALCVINDCSGFYTSAFSWDLITERYLLFFWFHTSVCIFWSWPQQP